VVTVVTAPPLPPLVLKRKRHEYIVKNGEENVHSYPPFNVAYPTEATSLTVARFSIGDA